MRPSNTECSPTISLRSRQLNSLVRRLNLLFVIRNVHYGSEWQKIALARAFMRDVPLLILDELTAALDAFTENAVYNRFAELTKGRTTIFVTHRLSSVRMAHKILVLKEGRLIEVGNHDEFLEQGGEYASLFKLQAERYQSGSN